jgi:hypothetical protein
MKMNHYEAEGVKAVNWANHHHSIRVLQYLVAVAAAVIAVAIQAI